MNRDIEHLINRPDHQWCSADGIDIRETRLPLVLRHRCPRITRDVEDAHLARCVLHADKQDCIGTRFLHIVHIDGIIEAEHQHIGIAVKAHIDRAAVFLLADQICLVHVPYITVCLNAPP